MEENPEAGERDSPSPDHSPDRHVVVRGGQLGTGVGHNVDVVTSMESLNSGNGHREVGPEAGHDQFFPAHLIHHPGDAPAFPDTQFVAIHGVLIGKDRPERSQERASKTIRTDRRQDGRDVESPGEFGKAKGVANQGLKVPGVDCKGKFCLVIDEDEDAIPWG